MLGQGDGLRRWLDLQLLGQPHPATGVDLQGAAQLALRQLHAHEAPIDLLGERIERQPAREGGHGLLMLPGSLVQGGEAIKEPVQAHLPVVLLLLVPFVKRGLLAQPEAVKEGTAHQGQSALEMRDQGCALLRGGGGGEHLRLLVGMLHDVQVELQQGTEHMGVRSRRGAGVLEQTAQQGNAIAQGGAGIVWFTVGPQEGGQLAAQMHVSIDGQVEQQGQRLAQGKCEAVPVMIHFRSAQHGQT